MRSNYPNLSWLSQDSDSNPEDSSTVIGIGCITWEEDSSDSFDEQFLGFNSSSTMSASEGEETEDDESTEFRPTFASTPIKSSDQTGLLDEPPEEVQNRIKEGIAIQPSPLQRSITPVVINPVFRRVPFLCQNFLQRLREAGAEEEIYSNSSVDYNSLSSEGTTVTTVFEGGEGSTEDDLGCHEVLPPTP